MKKENGGEKKPVAIIRVDGKEVPIEPKELSPLLRPLISGPNLLTLKHRRRHGNHFPVF
jgi:hypothetical protein